MPLQELPKASLLKGAKKALIIERNPAEGSVLGNMLSRYYNFKTELCTDAEYAVANACDIQPDIIFTEMEFDTISGLDIVEGIREFRQLQHIPIIVVSRLKDKEILAKLQNLKITYYFIKPIQKTFFDQKMSEIIQAWAEKDNNNDKKQ